MAMIPAIPKAFPVHSCFVQFVPLLFECFKKRAFFFFADHLFQGNAALLSASAGSDFQKGAVLFN